MTAMPLPDLDYATLPVPATADFQAIVKALATVPCCEPSPNALGNLQGVYRIDHEGGGGYLLTYPAAADAATVKAALTAVTPPAVPEPTIDEKIAVEVAKQLAAAGAVKT